MEGWGDGGMEGWRDGGVEMEEDVSGSQEGDYELRSEEKKSKNQIHLHLRNILKLITYFSLSRPSLTLRAREREREI